MRRWKNGKKTAMRWRKWNRDNGFLRLHFLPLTTPNQNTFC